MILTSSFPLDLAGPLPARLSTRQIQTRIDQLARTYLNPEQLTGQLADLPHQFQTPRPRPWPLIAWSEIGPTQVVGIHPPIFAAILAGTINTEAPIRGYTQASRQYLAPFYPPMARFVGGTVNSQGNLLDLGLWEKEERRHTPALMKVYTQLTGQPLLVKPHAARPYTPSPNSRQDLYRHGLHRIATEYGATCLYLWMMAHTTGPLQQVLGQLLIDEINHTVKFWGFGCWAYPETSFFKIGQTLLVALQEKWRKPQIQGSLLHTLQRMGKELNWSDWSFINQVNLIYTFGRVMHALLQWHQRLTPDYLRELLGEHG